MSLSKIQTLDRIRVPLRATDKVAAITELVDVLDAAGAVDDRDETLREMLEREERLSTGIGYGLAIPHIKSGRCKDLVIAAGKPAQPVDFQSIDGRPVTFVVLLVSPFAQVAAYQEAMAQLASLMNVQEFRAAVEQARTAQELHALIVAYERGGRDAR